MWREDQSIHKLQNVPTKLYKGMTKQCNIFSIFIMRVHSIETYQVFNWSECLICIEDIILLSHFQGNI